MAGRRSTAARQAPEMALHVAVSRFLRTALPTDATYTTFPLGGGGLARGQRLKAMGTRAGWPDLQVLYAGHAFLIELKSEAGRLSDDQLGTHRRIMNAGCPVVVARTLEEVDAALCSWGIPLRRRAA
ncbi:MAG: VRR-NUC domain-containing protein [Alphaproteobacteria bacterium]|nr:VRR-NUC domain-containing protein [Alphaproteobacteria bacterium]